MYIVTIIIINMESLDLSKTSSKMSTGADNQDGSSISELKEQIKIKKKCLDNANGLIHYYKGNDYHWFKI